MEWKVWEVEGKDLPRHSPVHLFDPQGHDVKSLQLYPHVSLWWLDVKGHCLSKIMGHGEVNNVREEDLVIAERYR